MEAASRLTELAQRRQSLLCVGLDPTPERLPKHLWALADPTYTFGCGIVEATQAFAIAYKPNLAFYEALGPDGWHTLAATLRHIRATTDAFIVLDGKRGDIGSTAERYATALYDQLGADAVTLAPYMGRDSIEPFLRDDKLAFVLGLTSNPSAEDFEYHGDPPLFAQVLDRFANDQRIGFVAGATRPGAFRTIRQHAPDNWLLVPGIGAQGGDIAGVLHHGLNHQLGVLINSTRAIIYADNGPNYAEKAGQAAQKLAAEIRNLVTF